MPAEIGAGEGSAANPALRRSGWRRLLAVPTPIVFAVSVLVGFALLARQGSLADVGSAAGRLHPAVVAAALALYAGGLLLLSLRWHALVRMAGGTVPAPVAAEVFLTSVVVNYAAPIGLAVPTRAALSKRDLGLTATGSGAVVLWEALLDLGILAAIGATWLVLGGGEAVAAIATEGRGWAIAAVVLVAVVATAGIGLLVFSRRVRERAQRFGGEALALPGRRPGAALTALALTLVFWALQAAILRLLLEAFGVIAPAPPLVLGLLGWPTFIGMISPVPGGAGVREALMVAVAGVARVDGAAVLLAALAYRVTLFLTLPFVFLAVRGWRALHPELAVREGSLRG
ncbi:MAG: flippase-like domain-containing protein [Chloroflexia bacterium]|nr:flippase-like domain-containing protein [Chloroflexia bacterium]